MDLIVAKAEKQLREEGKETTFYHSGVQLPWEKIQTFNKRRVALVVDVWDGNPGRQRRN
jgi:hypothetical protein